MTEMSRNSPQPFVTKFMEPIVEEDILDATGKYDEESQTWELESGSDSSFLMSGLNPEKPPSTCSRMTKIGHSQWTSDTYVDD